MAMAKQPSYNILRMASAVDAIYLFCVNAVAVAVAVAGTGVYQKLREGIKRNALNPLVVSLDVLS